MKNKVIFLFLFMGLLVIPLSAQQCVSLWGKQKAEHRQKTKLYIYPADSAANKQTAIIICPGGSYCWLGMKTEGTRVAQWFQKKGITAFVLHYRVNALYIRHPAMIQDLQKAIIYVRKHASEWGYKTNKVGVIGFSAGGHLAGMSNIYGQKDFIGLQGDEKQISLQPDFVGMIYPVISMQDSIVHWRSRLNLLGRHPSKALVDELSLEKNLRIGMAPVFLLNCKDDRTVKDANSVVFDRALSLGGIPHVYYHFDKGGHGFGMYPKKKGTKAADWGDKFLEWIKVFGML